MKAIKDKDSKPELIVRRGIHGRRFRYKLHDKTLPGKPDLVFPKYRAVVLVNGCFWHGHKCHLFKWPATRKTFWRDKISANRARDRRQIAALQDEGWRVAVVWECAVKKEDDRFRRAVIDELEIWLKGRNKVLDIDFATLTETAD